MYFTGNTDSKVDTEASGAAANRDFQLVDMLTTHQITVAYFQGNLTIQCFNSLCL